MKIQNLAAVAITAALAFAAVLMVAWQSRFNQPPTYGATTASSNPPAVVPAPSPSPDSANAESDANTGTSRLENIVPPRAAERCKDGFTIVRDAFGEAQGWQCNPSAYEDYSTESLEILAYGDAEAARVLAYRLRNSDYPRAIQMAQRTAALTGGETRTLLAATNWRSLANPNGDADLSGYGQAYVLHRLVERLKDSSYRAPPTYEKRIRELTDEPDVVFKKLDAVVDHMYDEIRRIELDITGESTIGRDDDA